MNNPLMNRMSTERINRVLEYNEKFPYSTKTVIDELMGCETFLNLSYDSVCVLNDIFDCGYNPTGIASLFESPNSK